MQQIHEVAYRLKRDESLPEGIRRIACEEIEAAANHLSKSAHDSEAVHEARKSIKKTRALLRIARWELGASYHAENSLLRDVARRLSPLRDAAALVETCDELRRKHGTDGGSRQALTTVRSILAAHKERAETEAARSHLAPEVASTLRAYLEHVAKWPLCTDGFRALRPGIENMFRVARKGLKRSEADPTPENFHEWRKRTKVHWYLTRLLENLWPDLMQVQKNSLHGLDQILGDDHNLAVLQEKLGSDPDFNVGGLNLKPLHHWIETHQRELRETAVAEGKRIYGDKPGRAVRRIEHLWELWRAEPDEALPEELAA